MPEIVQVKIKGTVVTQQYGTLQNGDILRTTSAFAKHLVEDAGAAEYLNVAVDPEKPAKTPRKKPAEPAKE